MMRPRRIDLVRNLFLSVFFLVLISFPILAPLTVLQVTKFFGAVAGALFSIVVLTAFLTFVYPISYRIDAWFDVHDRADARENYCGIYRVLCMPTDDNVWRWEAKPIEVGEFGWQHKLHTPKKGLIYLQGLTSEWRCVWRAGFRPDQIEYVARKPVSQYDWRDFETDGPGLESRWFRRDGKLKHLCTFAVKSIPNKSNLDFPTVGM